MSDITDLKVMLAEASVFKGLDDAIIAEIAGCATLERFEADSYLIRDGHPARHMYVIRHGTVAVELNAPPAGRVTLQTVHEGEVLGWSWLLGGRRAWTFDGRATTLVRAVAINGECLLGKIDTNHELGFQVMKRMVGVMAARLTAARMQMLDLYAPIPRGIVEAEGKR